MLDKKNQLKLPENQRAVCSNGRGPPSSSRFDLLMAQASEVEQIIGGLRVAVDRQHSALSTHYSALSTQHSALSTHYSALSKASGTSSPSQP